MFFDNSNNEIKLIEKSNIKNTETTKKNTETTKKNTETTIQIISGKKRIIHIGPKGGKYYENKNKKIYIK